MSDIRYINLQVTPQKWENQYFGDFEAPISLYPAPSRPTPTPTKTPTPTPTPSVTPSITPTGTPAPTKTPTPTPSISVSPTPTITASVTPSPTQQTPTPTPTISVTPSITPSVTPTYTPTQTATVTPTASVTPTHTPTPTPSSTPLPNPYYLLAENYDELLTEGGDYIDIRGDKVFSNHLQSFSSETQSTTYSYSGFSSGSEGLIVVGFGGEMVNNSTDVLSVSINGSPAALAVKSVGAGSPGNKNIVSMFYQRVNSDVPLSIEVTYDDIMEEHMCSVYRLDYVTFDDPYLTDTDVKLSGAISQLNFGTISDYSTGILFHFWDSGDSTTAWFDATEQFTFRKQTFGWTWTTAENEFGTGVLSWAPYTQNSNGGLGYKTLIGAIWK